MATANISEHSAAAKPDPASPSQLPSYLFWGLVPAVGILGGSNRITTSIVDVVEPEDGAIDLPGVEILVLEEATVDRVHLEESAKINSQSSNQLKI